MKTKSPIDVAQPGNSASSPQVDFGATDFERALALFDHSMICMYEAFARFQEQVIVAATGDAKLGSLELFILVILRTRRRPKNVNEVARILNRDDISNLQYSLRKLLSAKLIKKINAENSRVAVYDVTNEGHDIIEFLTKARYRYIVEEANDTMVTTNALTKASKIIHLMTGFYESAARMSSTWELVERNAEEP
jgi:predicted MarR family transcription regulator